LGLVWGVFGGFFWGGREREGRKGREEREGRKRGGRRENGINNITEPPKTKTSQNKKPSNQKPRNQNKKINKSEKPEHTAQKWPPRPPSP
jgi:hypothetical protein